MASDDYGTEPALQDFPRSSHLLIDLSMKFQSEVSKLTNSIANRCFLRFSRFFVRLSALMFSDISQANRL